MSRAAEARIKLDAIGLDEICDLVGEGESLTQIAKDSDVSIGSLLSWIESDPERSARVRECRASMARYWDEKSEKCIEDATDEFELKRAKELSHHYRWRASKIAPREYGDKVDHTSSDGSMTPVPTVIQLVAPE